MRKILKKLSPEALMPFITVDKASNVVKIRFDDLCEFLIRIHGRSFSTSVFEKKLQSEINTKLVGKPYTEKNMKALCRYIDDLSIYLSDTQAKVFEGKIPEDSAKEFFWRHKDVYDNVLERARRENPQEYEVLAERYKKRFESE